MLKLGSLFDGIGGWLISAKRNGKTTTLAAIALYMMVMDGEAGADFVLSVVRKMAGV